MRANIILLILLISYTTKAQSTSHDLKDNGIYISSDDFLNHHLFKAFNKKDSPGIKFKGHFGHINELWLKTTDTIYKLLRDELWGYRQNGEDWRIYKSGDYQVIYSDSNIVLYQTPALPAMDEMPWYFLSRGPCLPIYELSKRNLLAIYKEHLYLIDKIKNLKWYQSVLKQNRKTHRFLIVDWLSNKNK